MSLLLQHAPWKKTHSREIQICSEHIELEYIDETQTKLLFSCLDMDRQPSVMCLCSAILFIEHSSEIQSTLQQHKDTPMCVQLHPACGVIYIYTYIYFFFMARRYEAPISHNLQIP